MSFDNSQIIARLEEIRKKLEMESDKIIVDSEKKFQLEITKSVLDYSSNLMKDKIAQVIKDEISKFKFNKIVLDYSIVAESDQLEKILMAIEEAKREVTSDVEQNIDDFTKRIVLDFPIELGTSMVDKFYKKIIEALKVDMIGE